MLEKELQSRFTRWMRSGRGFEWMQSLGWQACAFELKLVHGDKLQFSKVPQHQEIALMRARGVFYPEKVEEGLNTGDSGFVDGEWNGLTHKISDSGIGYKPFDCFAMWGCGAYFVIGYLTEGGLSVYAISIVDYMKYKISRNGRGSFKIKIMEELGHALGNLV